MASTVIVDIADPLAEESDYLVTGVLVGDDGTTPMDTATVQTATATLRDVEADAVVFADRDVLSALSGSSGAFAMPLTAADLAATASGRFQRRLLTIKLTQINGKKRKHVVRFAIEDLTDVA